MITLAGPVPFVLKPHRAHKTLTRRQHGSLVEPAASEDPWNIPTAQTLRRAQLGVDCYLRFWSKTFATKILTLTECCMPGNLHHPSWERELLGREQALAFLESPESRRIWDALVWFGSTQVSYERMTSFAREAYRRSQERAA